MNTDPEKPTDHSEEAPNPGAAAESSEPGDFTRSVEDAFRNGAKDAKEAFDKAIPKAKEDLSRGVHDLAYALSYAATFGTELLKEVTPENVVEGIREGKDAGKRAADEIIRERKARREREERQSSTESGDGPGAADDSEPILV